MAEEEKEQTPDQWFSGFGTHAKLLIRGDWQRANNLQEKNKWIDALFREQTVCDILWLSETMQLVQLRVKARDSKHPGTKSFWEGHETYWQVIVDGVRRSEIAWDVEGAMLIALRDKYLDSNSDFVQLVCKMLGKGLS